MTKYLPFALLIVVAGCAFTKHTYIHVIGKNLRGPAPYGIGIIKGDVDITVNREVTWQTK